MAKIEVEIDGSGAKRGARTVTRSLDEINRKTAETGKRFTDASGKMREADGRFVKTGKSARQAGTSIKNVGSAAGQTTRALGQLAGAVAAAFSVTKIIQAGDAYTQLNNRLKLVTDSTEELVAVSENLFAISQDARVSFESTAELYQRVARASDALGKSTQEVLDVTEAVSQAITVSGVSAEAANAAIVQLGQGLASGALRGDELRSVLEQTPRLAQAIAEGLGVTTGALRELGAEGELTADKVFGALQSQAAVLNEEFGQLDATVSQSLTVLNNSFVRFIGRLDQTLGVTNNLADGFIALGKSIDGSVDSVEDMAFSFTQLVRAGTLSLTTLDNRFDQLQNTLVGTIATIFGDDSVAEAAANERVQIERELNAEINQITDFLSDERDAFEERKRLFKEAGELDLDVRPDGADGVTPVIDPAAAKEAQKLSDSLDKLAESVKRQVDPLFVYEQELAKLDELLLTDRITQEQFNAALAAAGQTYAAATPAGQEYNAMLAEGARVTAAALTPAEEYANTVNNLAQLLESGFITQETFARSVEDAAEQLKSATAETGALGVFLEQVAIQAARNIQTAFADFLFDPFDQGVEGLVSNFADALKRMAAEALSQQILSGIFNLATAGAGGGGTGIIQAIGGALAGRQTGGPLVAGQASMVGERGQEAFVPREAGQVVSNRELRQGAGAEGAAPNVNVPVEIINITDPSAIPAAMESAQGQKAILNVIGQNPDSVRRALS